MKVNSINPHALGTNSLTNAIMVASKQPEPKVGMGATIVMYSDRYAATIVTIARVSGIDRVHVREDIVTRIDNNGMSECQDYAYAPNPNAPVQVFTLRNTGRYVKMRQPTNGGTHLLIGVRDHYTDPSF